MYRESRPNAVELAELDVWDRAAVLLRDDQAGLLVRVDQRGRDAGGPHRVRGVFARLVLVQVEPHRVLGPGSRPNFAMSFSRWTAAAAPRSLRASRVSGIARHTSPSTWVRGSRPNDLGSFAGWTRRTAGRWGGVVWRDSNGLRAMAGVPALVPRGANAVNRAAPEWPWRCYDGYGRGG